MKIAKKEIKQQKEERKRMLLKSERKEGRKKELERMKKERMRIAEEGKRKRKKKRKR